MNKLLILPLVLGLLAACGGPKPGESGQPDTIRSEVMSDETTLDSATISDPADNTAAPGPDSMRSAPAGQ